MGPSGGTYVTGFTSSTDFPTMNPLQPANGGGSNTFVTEIGSLDLQVTPKSVKFVIHQVKDAEDGATHHRPDEQKQITDRHFEYFDHGTDPGGLYSKLFPCGKSLAAGASSVIKVTFKPLD